MATLVIGENTGNTSGLTDTWLTEAAPTTNKASDGALEVSDFAAGDRNSAIIQISLAALPGGSTVSATSALRMYLDSGGGSDPRSLVVRRLLKPAVITQATFNIYSTGNNWTTAGGEDNADAVSTPSATFDLSGLSGGAYISITGAGIAADIQGWKDATFSNYGWIISRADTPESSRYAVFKSSEGTDTNRPEVSIVYTAGGSALQESEWYPMEPQTSPLTVSVW